MSALTFLPLYPGFNGHVGNVHSFPKEKKNLFFDLCMCGLMRVWGAWRRVCVCGGRRLASGFGPPLPLS